MCIIMLDTRASEERVDRDILDRCREKNDDGMGIMYARGGKLVIWTTMKDMNGIWNRYTHARDAGLTVAIHFRIGTKGTTTLENCHPFFIKHDFAFMHNGTITWAPTEPRDVSDTRFIRDVFAKLPDDFLQDPGLRGMVKDSITGDRMVFMDADGNHDIINEISGFWHKGTWKMGGVWFSHSRIREYIIHGYEWKSQPNNRSVKHLTQWEGDGVRGHTKTCPCEACGQTRKRVVDQRGVGVSRPPYDLHEHGKNCVCRYCLDDRADAWHKRLAAERASKKAAEVKGADRDHKVINLFPDLLTHTELYNKRAYPAPNRDSMPRFLFGYGRFRDDLGAIGVPESAKKAGIGILLSCSLWVNELESLGDVAAALIEPDNSEMYIHGMMYDLQGTDAEVIEQLKGLDDLEGCVYGDPQASTYHRFLMPVKLAKSAENRWCWTYMANPDSAINTLLGPAVEGDWAEYLADAKADIPIGDFDNEGWGDVKLLTSGDDGPELTTLLTTDGPLDEGRFACPFCLGMNTLSTKHVVELSDDDDDVVGLFGPHVYTEQKALYCTDCCKETVINLPD